MRIRALARENIPHHFPQHWKPFVFFFFLFPFSFFLFSSLFHFSFLFFPFLFFSSQFSGLGSRRLGPMKKYLGNISRFMRVYSGRCSLLEVDEKLARSIWKQIIQVWCSRLSAMLLYNTNNNNVFLVVDGSRSTCLVVPWIGTQRWRTSSWRTFNRPHNKHAHNCQAEKLGVYATRNGRPKRRKGQKKVKWREEKIRSLEGARLVDICIKWRIFPMKKHPTRERKRG